MSHAVGNAVMDRLAAWRGNDGFNLRFRLGVEFRRPGSALLPKSRLPVRYFRIQVASPPPGRVDGTEWPEGLRMDDLVGSANGVTFDATTWAAQRRPAVFPLGGLAPLGLPEPDTLVFDQWIAVPPEADENAGTDFELTIRGVRWPGASNHFVSVDYPRPVIDGALLDKTGVTYSIERTVPLGNQVGDWIAISLDRFAPPERASADYIVAVDDQPPED